MLLWVVYGLVGTIGLMVFAVFLRETWRAWERRRFERLKIDCTRRLRVLKYLEPEDLAARLRASFSLPVIEKCLEEFAEESATSMREKLVQVSEDLGLVQARIEALTDARSWPERAAAAERLGRIGHSAAVLPLIAVLQDKSEDKQVKSVASVALREIRDPRAIEPLVEALGWDDAAIGQSVADTLAGFMPQAVPALLDVLKSSKTDDQRYWAVRILGASTDSETTGPLIAALQDRSEKVRSEAARSLGRLRARAAIHPLTETLLRDPLAPVREEAARALGEIGDEQALEALKQALGELPYEVRAGALTAMEKMGDEAVPLFLQALDEDDERTRTQAATALERNGYVDTLIERLADESGTTGGPSFLVLLKVARAGVVESLIQALSLPDLQVRVRVCQILGEVRCRSAVDVLSDAAVDDSEWAVRARALEALIRIGDPQTQALWLRQLREDEENVRECILEAMSRLSPTVLESMLPDLLPQLHDPNLKIRRLMVGLVGSIRSDRVEQALVESLSDSAADVRAQAASALGRFSKNDTVKALEKCLEDPESRVRGAAVRALGEIKDSASIPALAQAFENADDSYRDDIARALAAMKRNDLLALTDLLMGLRSGEARSGVALALGLKGDARALGLLQTFLMDGDPLVRTSAARALGELASPETGALLLPYLEDPDARVRAATVASLGRCQDPELANPLVPLLDDPDVAVGRQAALAIGQLGHPTGITYVQHFHARVSDPISQAAAAIGLTLLGDQTGLEIILEGLQDPRLAPPLRDLIRACTKETQQKFFAVLTLEPALFWLEDRQEFRSKVVEHYVGLLQSDRQPSARIRAMQALALFGESRCAPILESSLKRDPNATVRAQALESLGRFLDLPELLDRLVLAIRDPADEVRLQAARTLDGLNPDDVKPHREQLVELLETENDELQEAVCQLLSKCYRRDWRTLADRLMGAEKTHSLRGLIRTLSLIGDPKIGVLFLPILDHRDPEIRELAAEQLSHVASRLPLESLVPYLEDPNERVRSAIVRCLGKQMGAEVVTPLLERMLDPSPLVRQEVAAAFGRPTDLDDEEPVQVLTKMAKDASVLVRAQALASLIRLGVTGQRKVFEEACTDLDEEDLVALRARLNKDGTLPQVLEIMKTDRDAKKRADAVHFLAQADLQGYASEIVLALQDPATTVRMAAIETLGQLEDPGIQEAIEALSSDPVEAVRTAVKRRRLRSVSPRKEA
ncbi:MAG: HEAT repeat domain-containing protein [Gemmatimonadetes bacterium]|nr:HEAT repeat domain-containing protein [Gemmatimonadota bacterium]